MIHEKLGELFADPGFQALLAQGGEALLATEPYNPFNIGARMTIQASQQEIFNKARKAALAGEEPKLSPFEKLFMTPEMQEKIEQELMAQQLMDIRKKQLGLEEKRVQQGEKRLELEQQKFQDVEKPLAGAQKRRMEAEVQKILSEPTFEEKVKAEERMLELKAALEQTRPVQLLVNESGRLATSPTEAKYIGAFDFDPRTRKYRFIGFVPEDQAKDGGAGALPSQKASLIDRANQAAMRLMMDEVDKAIEAKYPNVAQANQIRALLTDPETRQLVVDRAFSFLPDDKKRQFLQMAREILTMVDAGANFARAVEIVSEKYLSNPPGEGGRSKIKIPGYEIKTKE